jgi:hypothetical protein
VLLQPHQAFQAIATRFAKHDANYLASIKLAAFRLWLTAL